MPKKRKTTKRQEIDNPTRCTCNEYKWPSHRCPYAADVNDDLDDEYCNCCPWCEQICADDI